jgi:hypothetical protein
VAAGSAAALICDTGALIDYLVESAPDHELFRDAIDQARTRYVPGLVLAEVDYLLRDERRAMQVFMQDLAQGAFTYAPPRPSVSSHVRWKWTGASRISAWASWIVRSWRSPSRSASVVWPRATCATSPPFDSATAAALIWWFIRWIPTSLDYQSVAWERRERFGF